MKHGPRIRFGVLIVLGVRVRGWRYLPVGAAGVDVNASCDGGRDDDVVRRADASGGDELVFHVVELGGVSMCVV